MVEINLQPSPRDVRVFGLLWLAFFAAVGGLALWKPTALLGAATFLTLAWLASLLLNSADRLRQLAGAFLPLVFGAAGGAVLAGAPARGVAAAAWIVAALGCLLIEAAPGLGRRAWVGWMIAALPIGWTVTHLVLLIVFFTVLTPIGLLLRLTGHDPLRRAFDPAAESYWIERKGQRAPASYFQQF
jgi:hypothetical protein